MAWLWGLLSRETSRGCIVFLCGPCEVLYLDGRVSHSSEILVVKGHFFQSLTNSALPLYDCKLKGIDSTSKVSWVSYLLGARASRFPFLLRGRTAYTTNSCTTLVCAAGTCGKHVFDSIYRGDLGLLGGTRAVGSGATILHVLRDHP